MEFKRGKLGRRQDRRICPRCQSTRGQERRCKPCNSLTKARIEIKWYVDGRRYRELTTCWREQEANAILQRKEADYWRQQEFGVERDVGGSLREATDAFLAMMAEFSASHQKQCRTAVHTLAAGVGWDCPVPTISATDIARYKEDGLTVRSPSTVRSYMLVLRRFFGFLHQQGWIRRNPTARIKLPVAKKGRDHLRPEEVGVVLQAFWELDPVMAPIFTAFMLGGWRKGELINLRRSDMYLGERWAYVLDFEGDELASAWTPKTESSRRAVPLHPLVVKALTRVDPIICPDGKTSPWVFPIIDERKRKRYTDALGRVHLRYGDRRSSTTTSFGRTFRRVLDEVGISRRVTVHGLRRTFAILLQDSGAPFAVIRQALGHCARGVTETHYLPRRDETVMRWVDAIEVSIPALE